MTKKLLSTISFILSGTRRKNLIIQNITSKRYSRKTILFVIFWIGFFIQSHGQQIDTWLTADRAINIDPTPNGSLHLFTPYAPADGTPVTTWYDFVDFIPQDAVLHPSPPVNATYQLAPPSGFDYPFGTDNIDFLIPGGTVPGQPTLRRDVFNFNPAIQFIGNGAGQALHFRSNSRDETTVFIVFQGEGSGNSAESQRLLYGGDINNHPTTTRATNLSLGVSDGNRFSVGRTRSGVDANASMWQPGNVDLLGRPTIAMFERDTINGQVQERLRTRVNGIDDINWLRDETPFLIADTPLFPYNRIGKHFNSDNSTSDRNFTGNIAEIIVLDTPVEFNLTDAIERIESYLAIKYGITLNNLGGLGSSNGNISYDYLAADGSVIWDFDLADPYNFDIAGLGKDRFEDIDNTPGPGNSDSYLDIKLRYNLHQRIAKSVNIEATVTMSTNTDFVSDNLDDTRTYIETGGGSAFSTDHNYLLWGNNRASLMSTNVELPLGTVTERISREWKVQMNRSDLSDDPIQGVGVMVDLSGSDITITPECALYLMIDTDGDGDFTTGPITYIEAAAVDVGTRIAEFHNVDFQHANVFTIGFGDFTPPTGTINNVVVCDIVPPVDITDVINPDDNCAVALVEHIGDLSDGMSNPETIIRTYRITDTSGNTTDVQQTIAVYSTPNAGTNNMINICVDDSSVDLVTALGVADTGGIWSDDNPAMVSLIDPSNVDFTGVSAGMYGFTYTVDAANPICSNASATITVTISPAPKVSAGSNEQICVGETHDFSTSVTIPSAEDYSTLSWSTAGDGSFNDNSLLTPIYTPGATDISNGSVVLTLTANGCTSVSDDMTLTINEIPTITVDNFSNPMVCGGNGTIELLITGITAGLHTIFHDSGNFPNINVSPGGSATIIAPQGVYNSLRITKANGCTSVEDPDVTLTDPIGPNINPLGNVSVCNEFILPNILGTNLTGSEAYYDLPGGPGGGGTLFNAGTPITTSGTYYIYDQNGTCVDEESFNINILPSPPQPVVSVNPEDCNGDATNTLDNYDNTLSYSSNPVGLTVDGSGNITGGTDGTNYVITATNSDGCATDSASFTFDAGTQLPSPGAPAAGPLTFCSADNPTGANLVPAIGGSITWYSDAGLTNVVDPADPLTSQDYFATQTTSGCESTATTVTVTINTTPTADGPSDVTQCDSYVLPALATGNYFEGPGGTGNAYSAGDAITSTTLLYVYAETGTTPNCTDENSFTVTINSLSVTLDINHESCWESGDGFIDIVIENGVGPFDVQINSQQTVIFSDNTFTINELNPGNYFINVTDNNGCQTITEFDILPGGPNLDATIEPVYSCDLGSPTNSILVNLNDPSISENVLYALDSTNPEDFILTPDFGNINAGNHFLSILHTNGCLVSIPFSIEDTTPLELELINSSTNEITANVSGGAPPYTYFFDDQSGSSDNTYTIDRSGTFVVRVLDGNGCEIIETITMNFYDIEIPNFFTPNNDGQNDIWRPRNVEPYPNIETFIFDRYGRKIKIMGPLNEGWDGTYESKPLPSGDYWFIIELNDGTGREFVGHFTLYR